MFEIHNDDGATFSAIILACLSAVAGLMALLGEHGGHVRFSATLWVIAVLSAVMCIRSIYYWLVALPLWGLRDHHKMLSNDVRKLEDRRHEDLREAQEGAKRLLDVQDDMLDRRREIAILRKDVSDLRIDVSNSTDRFDEYMRCNNTEIHDIKEDIQYLKKDVCKALAGSEEKPKKRRGKTTSEAE